MPVTMNCRSVTASEDAETLRRRGRGYRADVPPLRQLRGRRGRIQIDEGVVGAVPIPLIDRLREADEVPVFVEGGGPVDGCGGIIAAAIPETVTASSGNFSFMVCDTVRIVSCRVDVAAGQPVLSVMPLPILPMITFRLRRNV